MSDPAETLREWAARVAPDVTDWQRVRRVAGDMPHLQASDTAWALHLALDGGPGDASGYDRCRALLAYVEELAEGLTESEGQALALPRFASRSDALRLMELCLLTTGMRQVTALGTEVAAVLRRARGGER